MISDIGIFECGFFAGMLVLLLAMMIHKRLEKK